MHDHMFFFSFLGVGGGVSGKSFFLFRPVPSSTLSSALFSTKEPCPAFWRFWLSSCPFHTWLKTTPVHAEGHAPMKPTKPHQPQKAGCFSQVSKADTLLTPATESETRGKPGRVQHRLKTCLTLWRGHRQHSHPGCKRTWWPVTTDSEPVGYTK